MNKSSETFIIYVASLNLTPGLHLDRATQIAFLLVKKVGILDKYTDFADIFSKKKSLVLPKYNEINEYTIDLDDGKQPAYEPIYSLDLIELEILKTYIETHLKTGFIWLSKSLTSILILFDKKIDNSLYLCVNYQGLNNFTIKN